MATRNVTADAVNILLVEDDDVDVETVRRGFARQRIANTITVARDGVEALEMLENGSIRNPITILLDINMPRMNGLEFLRALRANPNHHQHIVFVLTTSADQDDIYAAYDLNVAGYMLKSNVGIGFFEAVSMLKQYWRVVEMPQPVP